MNEKTQKHVDILGIPVLCLDLTGLLQAFLDAVESKNPKPVTFAYVNSHVLNRAYDNPSLHSQLNAMSVVYADGIGPVLAGRLLNGCRLVKMTGADWIHPLAAAMARRKLRIFILAGKPGVAEKAADQLLQLYPGLEIAGTADGYFSASSMNQTLHAIRETGPDALFVGMGTPQQEAWIATHSRTLPVRVVWGVGALFDYLVGEEARAPRWMLRWGLEWLWRLRMDPVGKWKRYLLGNPLFLWRVLQQKRQSEGR